MSDREWAEGIARTRDDGAIVSKLEDGGVDVSWDDGLGNREAVSVPPAMCPALAALAMDGTRWGFTWKDVDLLRELAFTRQGEDDGMALENLAARIEALIRPEEHDGKEVTE